MGGGPGFFLRSTAKMDKKKNEKIWRGCWDYFHCRPEEQKECLQAEAGQWQCWEVNIACCRIPKDAPRPLSVKKVVCLTCPYYLESHKKR